LPKKSLLLLKYLIPPYGGGEFRVGGGGGPRGVGSEDKIKKSFNYFLI